MPRGRIAQDPKRCIMCKEVKPRSEFYKMRCGKGNSVESRCIACCRVRAVAYGKTEQGRMGKAASCRKYSATENGKRQRLKNNLKSSVGLTVEQFTAMLTAQDNKCAICKVENGVPRRRLAADHCHETGVFRGVLCHKCNLGIGFFNDNVEKLAAAIDYIVSRRLPVK